MEWLDTAERLSSALASLQGIALAWLDSAAECKRASAAEQSSGAERRERLTQELAWLREATEAVQALGRHIEAFEAEEKGLNEDWEKRTAFLKEKLKMLSEIELKKECGIPVSAEEVAEAERPKREIAACEELVRARLERLSALARPPAALPEAAALLAAHPAKMLAQPRAPHATAALAAYFETHTIEHEVRFFKK